MYSKIWNTKLTQFCSLLYVYVNKDVLIRIECLFADLRILPDKKCG